MEFVAVDAPPPTVAEVPRETSSPGKRCDGLTHATAATSGPVGSDVDRHAAAVDRANDDRLAAAAAAGVAVVQLGHGDFPDTELVAWLIDCGYFPCASTEHRQTSTTGATPQLDNGSLASTGSSCSSCSTPLPWVFEVVRLQPAGLGGLHQA